MSQAFVDYNNYRNGGRVGDVSTTIGARADRILSRAEGRAEALPSSNRDAESVRLDRMDKLALAVGSIMTIGPLFAAYLGSLMVS